MPACQNPTCGKEVPQGRRYCGERCSNAARQRNFRERNARGTHPGTVTPKSNGRTTPRINLFSGVTPAIASTSEETKRAPSLNRKDLAPATAYKGRGISPIVPSWLGAEPVKPTGPTVAELIDEQFAKEEADRAKVVAEVDEFLPRWEDIADPIPQVQLLRNFAGLPSAKEHKEWTSVIESLGRTMPAPRLNLTGREVATRLPDFVCPHGLSWMVPCEDCDAGIRYEDVRKWTLRQWRDFKGNLTGQSRGANAALSKLGMSKWAETKVA